MPYGRNFRGTEPSSVLVGVRKGKRVSLIEEKCLSLDFKTAMESLSTTVLGSEFHTDGAEQQKARFASVVFTITN